MTTENTNNPAQPLNKSQLDNAQSDIANNAMDGIARSDINQDNASDTAASTTDESLLDMLHESKKPE